MRHVRIVAPSSSYSFITPAVRALAEERLRGLGLTVSAAAHVDEHDLAASSSIEHRVADLHDAFADPSVDAILTVLGGYNANQLLPHLEWDLIAANPRVFCGYSDITALTNSIWAGFRRALMTEESFDLAPAITWSDDAWYLDQEARTIRDGDGHWVLNQGRAEGTLLGGNLCTLNLLQGTEWMPDLDGSIVVVEDDLESHPATFDRDLTSLIQQPGFDGVRGLVIGRFQDASEMSRERLEFLVSTKPELASIPVIANVDIGHTDPILTWPVGGRAELVAEPGETLLRVVR